MADVICLGEAIIDLVPTEDGLGLAEAATFLKAAGGAPANVAAGVARLGESSGFIGMVGDDGFGRFLADSLAGAGVDIGGLKVTGDAATTLAAVSLQAHGAREFLFYGNPGAHSLLAPEHIDEDALRAAKILHVGSISLIHEPARTATLHALDLAHRLGLLVSYDPNLRLALWPSQDAARAGLRLPLASADIVKIAEEEVAFLTGHDDIGIGARALWQKRTKLMAVTRGAGGCIWFTADATGTEAGFPVDAVDTTGAGDAFMAGLLVGILLEPTAWTEAAHVERAIRFANATGALATTRRGAIPSLPDCAAVEALIAEHVR